MRIKKDVFVRTLRAGLCLLFFVADVGRGMLFAQDQAAPAALQAQNSQPAGKISLDLKGMDIIEVIKMLATKGNMNVVIGSNVKGRVTIFLKSVDLLDAFQIILAANDLAYDKRGDIYYVMGQKEYESMYGESYDDKKEVKIFRLKYAKASDVGKALNQIKTKIGKVIIDDGSNTIVIIDSPFIIMKMSDAIESLDFPTVTKIYELKYAKASDIKSKVNDTLTKGVGQIQIDERTNKLVVTDLEKKMNDITSMVTAFDERPKQVLIEAKIVSITLNDDYKLGVDWDAVIKHFQKAIQVKNLFNVASMTPIGVGGQILVGSLGSGENYAAMIRVLKEVGDANLLSSPRVTALNNQEAKILIGTSQPYATGTVTQGTSNATSSYSVNFIDVGVKLYVTPTINKAAATAVAAAPAAGAPAAAAPAAEAKTEFDVILASVPADKKIATIKAVREVKAGLGLAEAKALVEGAPKPVLEGANKADADAAKKKLEDAGAKVEVK